MLSSYLPTLVGMSDRDLSKMTKTELLAYAARLQDQQSEEMVVVNTKLPRWLRDDLRDMATDQGTTLRAVIQQGLTEWLDSQDQDRQD